MQLKPSQRLYSSVYLALVQLLPNECDSRLTNMVLLMIESEKTSRDVVEQANSLLAESKVSVKAVLNKYRRYVPDSLHQEL